VLVPGTLRPPTSQRLIHHASRLARALGRPTLSLRMPDPNSPMTRSPRKARFWLSGVWVGEPHLRGAYHGNPSTPHDQASISIRFSCCRRTRLHTGSRWHPQIVQPGYRQKLPKGRSLCWSRTVPVPACMFFFDTCTRFSRQYKNLSLFRFSDSVTYKGSRADFLRVTQTRVKNFFSDLTMRKDTICCDKTR